jgi:hypothetical protein
MMLSAYSRAASSDVFLIISFLHTFGYALSLPIDQVHHIPGQPNISSLIEMKHSATSENSRLFPKKTVPKGAVSELFQLLIVPEFTNELSTESRLRSKKRK